MNQVSCSFSFKGAFTNEVKTLCRSKIDKMAQTLPFKGTLFCNLSHRDAACTGVVWMAGADGKVLAARAASQSPADLIDTLISSITAQRKEQDNATCTM